jgi:spermidine/putrescine transport system substrate-binding protein
MKRFFPKIAIMIMWVFLLFSSVRIMTKSNLLTNKNTIHVFTFPEQFSYEALQSFEKETGIKVIVHNFSNNEELIAKMNRTKGYDLITPSDYAVKILNDQKLLKPLDKSKLNFYKHIDPFLLNRSYDPNNTYSLPYDWEVMGFGMEKELLEKQKGSVSWDLIFDKKNKHSIAMTNDPIEALSFASFYLTGSKQNLSAVEITNVKNLLIEQKKSIEAYTAIRGDYFLVSENCEIALAPSSFLLKAIKQKPSIAFVLPKEGTFITIENIAIPATTKNEELVYKFINFIYKAEYQAEESSRFLTFPARVDALKDTSTNGAFKKALLDTRKEKNKIHTIDMIMTEQEARQAWVEVKAS